jgi:hypothetical protein
MANEWMTEDQRYCYQMLCDWLGGVHNLPTVKPCGYGIKVSVRDGVSTFDCDLLTALVFFAHERCIRVEIANGSPSHVSLRLHRRHARNGAFYERHPTIEDALALHKKRWPSPDNTVQTTNESPKRANPHPFLGLGSTCNNRVEDRFPSWHTFGEYQDGLHVDLCINFNHKGERLIKMQKESAEILIEEHNKIIDALCETVNCFEQVDLCAFDRFWYGKHYYESPKVIEDAIDFTGF